jgi:diadenosine tetraphosphate (Ap4A) HIT family hydrolase
VSACPYCSIAPEDAWIVTEDAVAVPHPQPLTLCHIVVAPRRHVPAFCDLDVHEQRMVWDMVAQIRQRIESYLKVEGFHLGFEDGSANDPDPSHARIHVVPRTPGAPVALPAGIEWVDGSQ